MSKFDDDVEDQKTRASNFITQAEEFLAEGKIIAAGNGKILDDGKRQPLEVKKGDRVLFGKYAGTEINIDGEEHLIMREDDIIAIIE